MKTKSFIEITGMTSKELSILNEVSVENYHKAFSILDIHIKTVMLDSFRAGKRVGSNEALVKAAQNALQLDTSDAMHQEDQSIFDSKDDTDRHPHDLED